MKKKNRLLCALGAGFVAAMIIMSVLIYMGYTQAYSGDVDTLTVKMLGLPIYELTKAGTAYTGEAQGIYMGAVCGICMAAAVAIQKIAEGLRSK